MRLFLSRSLHIRKLMQFSVTVGIIVGCPALASDEDMDDFEEFGSEFEDRAAKARIADPLGPVNRGIFWVNDRLYLYAFKPVAIGYSAVVTEPVRVSVDNFFDNLEFPIRFVNNILQLKWRGAGVELGRFAVNSTAGVGGLFDPASRWFSWRTHDEDFGQTLGHYGVGSGIALQLPLSGPTNLRDGLGKVPEYFLDPLNYLEPSGVGLGVRNYDRMNTVSLNIGFYEELKQDALDPYTHFRDIYEQRRQKMIEE